MEIRKLIKKDAWLAMRNSWGKASAITLIFFAFLTFSMLLEKLLGYLLHIPYFIDSTKSPTVYLDDVLSFSPASLALSLASLLVWLLLYAPLALGNKKWFLGIANGASPSVSVAFAYFSGLKDFFRAFGFQLQLLIRKALWWLLITMPAIIVFIVWGFLKYIVDAKQLFMLQLAFFALFLFLFILCQLLVICFWQRYFLAEYLYVLHRCKSREAIKMSVTMMKGHRSEIFTVMLTFLPYYFANILWIPAFITLPHMNTVYAIYAKYYMEQFEKQMNTKFPEPAQNTNGIPSGDTQPLPNLKAVHFPPYHTA